MTEKKEQTSDIEKILFGIARVFTIICADIAIVVIIILSIALFRTEKISTHISLPDIKKEASYKSIKSNNTIQPRINLSPKAAQFFEGKDLTILTGWISSLNKEEADDFLSNLSAVIEEAIKNNEDVISVINEYKILKLKKFSSSKFDKYEALAAKGATGAMIFGLILFTSLMTLLLVALAIERNIREIRNNQRKHD